MNVPKLRFKADDGSEFPKWEEKTFSEILSENKIPIPKPTNGYERLGIRSHGKGTFHEYVPEGEGLDVDTMYVVEAYNLILNITFAWEQAIAVTDDKDDGKLVSHRFPQYKFNDGFDWHYFKYDILDKKLKHELGLASPGGAGRNRVLNKSDFLKIKRVVPCLNEQKKIAAFLSTIDEIISSTESELTAWQERKKGVIQKIFNREVRFKADDGSEFPEWEEKKIGDFLNESRIPGHTGKQAKKLTVKLWAKGIVPKESYLQGSEGTQYYVRHAGQLMYGKLDFLNCAFGIVPEELDGYESTIDSPAFDIHGILSDYLLAYITRKEFYKRNGDLANGTRKAKRIQPDVFFDMDINVPSLPEQKKIADCLSSLDDVINQIKAELSAWKEFKKGLLQQMFV